MDSTDCGKKAFHSLFGFPRLEREEAVGERGLWLFLTLSGSIFHIGWFYLSHEWLFLPDPGVSGVRSMGPGLSI